MSGDVAAAVSALTLPASSVREYVEVHMEQGPVLERKVSALLLRTKCQVHRL